MKQEGKQDVGLNLLEKSVYFRLCLATTLKNVRSWFLFMS